MEPPLRTALANIIWHLPGKSRLAQLFQPRSALRCVLFHNVATDETSFTRGLGVTLTPGVFEERLRYLRRCYTPVSLAEVESGIQQRTFDRPPVLVTFDDAYRSVLTEAAPICQALNIEPVLFANGGLLGNRTLALDNLLAHVWNTQGLEPIARAAEVRMEHFAEIFRAYIPTLTLGERRGFASRLTDIAKVDDARLAAEHGLYLDAAELAELRRMGFSIGSHTLTHTHLRSLTPQERAEEIAGNRSLLEEATGAPVHAFSYPYGSKADATPSVRATVESSGHTLAFLVEGLPNVGAAPLSMYRVSLKGWSDARSFLELEVLPPVRVLLRRFTG